MIRYSESLTPSLPVHLALLTLLPMGFGMVAPLTVLGGIVTAIAIYLAALVALVGFAPKISVTDTHFSAGRATMERAFIATAKVVTKSERHDAIADARTWKVLRAWIPGGVFISLSDPADPTPSWFVSTRRPERLVEALQNS